MQYPWNSGIRFFAKINLQKAARIATATQRYGIDSVQMCSAIVLMFPFKKENRIVFKWIFIPKCILRSVFAHIVPLFLTLPFVFLYERVNTVKLVTAKNYVNWIHRTECEYIMNLLSDHSMCHTANSYWIPFAESNNDRNCRKCQSSFNDYRMTKFRQMTIYHP